MIEIIPAIDIIGGKCVRLQQGDYAAVTEYRADPRDMAARMADHGFTRIHAVDLDGARLRRPENLRTLEQMASVDGVRVEWGGGLADTANLTSARNAGATYLVAGSVAVSHPELFTEWLKAYGADTMVLGADARNGKIAVSGWLEETDATVESLVKHFLPDGLTQAIVTDISKDGMLQGPNTDLYLRLQEAFPTVSFTVSGGISGLDDIKRLNDLGLRRVIVGKALYEGRVTLEELEHYVS